MLSMQLQPHFLFNTLNAIAELVHRQPDAAERMIAGLSHLLRETLHAGLVDRVPLAAELQLLDRYVEIQRARFGDRLDVSTSRSTMQPRARAGAEPVAAAARRKLDQARHRRARAARAASRLTFSPNRASTLAIEIRDDGRGLGATAGGQDGVGLGTVGARLQTLYGRRTIGSMC